MKNLHIDFETYSLADLKKTGADVYSRHPSTGISCAAWVIGENPADIQIWFPSDPIPTAWTQPDIVLCAHNIEFERSIWLNTLRLPAPSKWLCTLALAGASNLPLSLDEASKALGLVEVKDKEGYQLMRKMMRAGYKPVEGELERLAQYCVQDVVVEIGIYKRLCGILTPTEREVFALDQKINERGIEVDVETAKAVYTMVQRERDRLGEEILALSGGAIETGTQVARILKWLHENGMPEIKNLTASTVADALLNSDTPVVCRRMLEIRSNWALGSIGKYAAMVNGADKNNIMRNLLQYCGAQQTGRWAGRRVQVQNLPRGTYTDSQVAAAIGMYQRGDREGLVWAFGDVFEPAKRIIRSMFHCPGGMIVSDFSQIEARVVAWLAGQADLLSDFAAGEPVYEKMAAKIFRVPVAEVSKIQRQVGKVATLACQYGLGAKGFQASVKAQAGLIYTQNEAQTIVDAYRLAVPQITNLWYSTHAAFATALSKPYKKRVEIKVGHNMKVCRIGERRLQLELPSGRKLYWHDIEDTGENEFSYLSASGATNHTRGAILIENIAQAVARDIMAAAMLRLDAAGYEICMHVHDEVVLQNVTPIDVEKVTRIMSDIPAWAKGLPVAAETKFCSLLRYTK